MDDTLYCWKCGEDLAEVERPLRRAATCPACLADLHVCRMCRHFDPDKRRGCREPVAEEVRDPLRANFCGWLQPAVDRRPASNSSAAELQALESLFGIEQDTTQLAPSDADSARQALDDLFDDPPR